MPMPRKPLAVHELQGTIKKNPGRYESRKNEPRVEPLAEKPPTHLSTAEKKIWKEIVAIAPTGALGSSDKFIVELACRLIVSFRTGQLLKTSEVAQLVSVLGRLGLTPADRAKLNVEQPADKSNEPADPFSQFLQ